MLLRGKLGGQSGHRKICTAFIERTCSLNMTWGGKNSCKGSFLYSVTAAHRWDATTGRQQAIPKYQQEMSDVSWGHEARRCEEYILWCTTSSQLTSICIQTAWRQATKAPKKTLLFIHGRLWAASSLVFHTHRDEPSSIKTHLTYTLAASE